MGPSSAEYEQQIAEVRGSMESKIIELRERSRATLRRGRRALLIAAGVGAGLGAAAVTAYAIYRWNRRPTVTERLERTLPGGWWNYLRNAREKFELGWRRTVPPMRLYVGDRQVGEEPPTTAWEKVAVKAAQAAATAAASAVVARAVSQLQGRGKKAA
jgi:hypothetical protein